MLFCIFFVCLFPSILRPLGVVKLTCIWVTGLQRIDTVFINPVIIYLGGDLNKEISLLAFVEFEMIIANSKISHV